jgi:hypothetical protein
MDCVSTDPQRAELEPIDAAPAKLRDGTERASGDELDSEHRADLLRDELDAE